MDEDDALDLRGLKCPLPALLARKALAAMMPGAMLTVLADDPMAVVDIPHMCHQEGHGVTAVTRGGDHAVFRLTRAAVAADGPPAPDGR